MQPVTFSEKTWHYRLAAVYGDIPKHYYTSSYLERYKVATPEERDEMHPPGDICEYVRNVLKGALLVLIIIAICSFVSWPIADAIAYIIASIQTHVWTHVPISIFIIVTAAIIAVTIIGVSCIHDGLKHRREMHKEYATKPDSFLKQAYRKFKDKICFQVVIQ